MPQEIVEITHRPSSDQDDPTTTSIISHLVLGCPLKQVTGCEGTADLGEIMTACYTRPGGFKPVFVPLASTRSPGVTVVSYCQGCGIGVGISEETREKVRSMAEAWYRQQ